MFAEERNTKWPGNMWVRLTAIEATTAAEPSNIDWTSPTISKKQSVRMRWNTQVLLTELCSS